MRNKYGIIRPFATIWLLYCLALTAACAQNDGNMKNTTSTQNLEPRLDKHLEAQLDTVRHDPIKAIGFGDKAWLPYYLNTAEDLVSDGDSQISARLYAEASRTDNALSFRLAALQLLGWRSDPGVDSLLIASLADSALRPLSAFLLGRIGYKGYPRRDRPARQILMALKMYLSDESIYQDPWYNQTFLTQDFIIASFVRVAGVDRFHFVQEEKHKNWIGLELPSFDQTERDNLRRQCDALILENVPETKSPN
jgi:hypothetical protein